MTLAAPCPGCGVMGAGCICAIINPPEYGWPVVPVLPVRVGWQCPVCGAGVAPHIEKCPCKSKEGK